MARHFHTFPCHLPAPSPVMSVPNDDDSATAPHGDPFTEEQLAWLLSRLASHLGIPTATTSAGDPTAAGPSRTADVPGESQKGNVAQKGV